MNNFDQLSNGCKMCQQGKWLCIFLTYRCDANCHFCPAPFKNDIINSSFGNNKEVILSYLKRTDFAGISFSGGDPFLVFDRLIEWFNYFKKHLPDYYYWAYTNGMSVTERKMQQLSAGGMDEIRFNIAATGYLDAKIWRLIKIARNLFPFVTIEIPSINQDFELLAVALENLERIEVDFLNLHDYILQGTDAEFVHEGNRTFLLNKVIPLKYDNSSIRNTENIIDLTLKKGYGFQINHCSMQQKELQMTQRRLNMGKLFNDPGYDLVFPDGTICNFYSLTENLSEIELQKEFVNPEFRKKLSSYLVRLDDPKISDKTRSRLVRVYYIPKMSVGQDKIFLRAEIQKI